jgi:hypothetical protein
MKLATGLWFMGLGAVGIARGAALDAGRQVLTAHAPHLAALLGTLFFVGGLMLVARKDAFAAKVREVSQLGLGND